VPSVIPSQVEPLARQAVMLHGRKLLSWEDFAQSVSEAERLARPEDFDFLGLITDGYSQLRRYGPTLLETFDFRAAPVVTP
jgi:hypothetical protein